MSFQTTNQEINLRSKQGILHKLYFLTTLDIQLTYFCRDAVQGQLPSDEAQGPMANTQGALTALAGTVGGGLKGVVDTTGNTVGSLAQGLQGTTQGIGDGLSSTVQFTGGAVSSGIGQLGHYVTGEKSSDSESDLMIPDKAQSDEGDHEGSVTKPTERRVLPDRYETKESTKPEDKTGAST